LVPTASLQPQTIFVSHADPSPFVITEHMSHARRFSPNTNNKVVRELALHRVQTQCGQRLLDGVGNL
jgi:hypothetical protein